MRAGPGRPARGGSHRRHFLGQRGRGAGNVEHDAAVGFAILGQVAWAAVPALALGLLIGAIAILLASYSLVLDYENIRNGIGRVPAKYAWSAAFGLTVTLIWLYVEILRMLAILRGNN